MPDIRPDSNAASPLMLASSSPYREALLQRLHLPFSSQSPAIDESPLPDESPESLVVRLALEKARAVAAKNPESIVIGSDQVAVLAGTILTKPLQHDRAMSQLQQMSGNNVQFFTGLCVVNTTKEREQTDCILYTVHFRSLSDDEIEDYLRKEQPYDCAGSFKSEGLGIGLLESMTGPDPTALIGLPLIRLSEMLRGEGFSIP